MASPEPIISLDQVRFGYGVTPVVDGVTARLLPGKVTALIGPNAAGKSTLMRLMLGLLRPWSGKVRVLGQEVGTMAPLSRARQLSYVPQRPGVRFAFTVRQVVAMGANALARRLAAPLVDQAIEDAGLAGLADRVLMELSGGQQQRVMLARAEVQSATQGRAMLLDEPGSHLDLRHRHAMMRRLRELAAGGVAVLVVLHELDLAVRYADEAWLIDAGRLVAAGQWDEVLTPGILSPVYGMPLEQIDRAGQRPILAAGAGNGDTIAAASATGNGDAGGKIKRERPNRSLQEWDEIQAQRRQQMSDRQDDMSGMRADAASQDPSQMTMAERIELARQRARQQAGLPTQNDAQAEALRRARAHAERQAQQQREAAEQRARREQAMRQERAQRERAERIKQQRRREAQQQAEEQARQRRRTKQRRQRTANRATTGSPREAAVSRSAKRVQQGRGSAVPTVTQAASPTQPIGSPTSIGSLTRSDLRKAFIMKELLDKPVALRDPQADLPS
eukprot:g14940.t1